MIYQLQIKIAVLLFVVSFSVIPVFFVRAQNADGSTPPADGGGSTTVPTETSTGIPVAPPETGGTTTPPTDTNSGTQSSSTPPVGGTSTTNNSTGTTITPPISTPPPQPQIIPPGSSSTGSTSTSNTNNNSVPNVSSVNTEPPVPQTDPNSLTYVLGLVVAGLALLGGFGALFLKSKKNKKNDPCGKIKEQLEKRKKELSQANNEFSIQEAITEKLKEKIEGEKNKLKGKAIDTAKEKILEMEKSGKLKRAVDTATTVKETYDDMSRKYEKAKGVLELLKKKQKVLETEVETIEASYSTCVATRTTASTISGGLKINLQRTGSGNTKFILVGGFAWKGNNNGKDFCEELVKDYEEPVKIVCAQFARPRELWNKLFSDDKEFFLKNLSNKKIEVEIGEPNAFVEQIKRSDVIYLKGGDDIKLIELLPLKFDWIKELRGKTLVGSSAGANLMAKYYYSLDDLKIKEGLGILPIKVIVHYGSDYNSPNINWDKVYREMYEYKENLPIFTLKEGEFNVQHIKDGKAVIIPKEND